MPPPLLQANLMRPIIIKRFPTSDKLLNNDTIVNKGASRYGLLPKLGLQIIDSPILERISRKLKIKTFKIRIISNVKA